MAAQLYTDVLVIGGGGAGLCSALSAAENGASVTLVYQRGGNSTAMAAGGFAVVPEGSQTDTVDCFVADALRSGAQLASPELLRTLGNQAPRAIETISGWGVAFYRNEDGSYRLFRSGGHSNPRSLRCASGRGSDAYRVMLDRAKTSGIHILPNTTITQLLKNDERVVGGVGLTSEGIPLVILAKAVILATGGMGALYTHTTNSPGLTGEGYYMAHEVGCRLRDMEFVQFMPTTIAYPPQFSGQLVNDTLRGEGAYLLNRAGERFMARYDPRFMEVAGRDILSIAIADQVRTGEGSPHGGVYLDARHIPEGALLQSFGAAKAMRLAGVDPARDLIEVVPAAHFSCGGVVIDAECRTGVDGLLAVGEVTGGIHGANRLGATALTENLVFGRIAGRNAALEAAALTVLTTLPEQYFMKDLAQEPTCETAPQAEFTRLETEIKAAMWQYAGILRSAQGLAEGQALLRQLAEEAAALPARGAVQLVAARRLEQLAELGLLVMQSALARTESRGCHYRTDYPGLDPSQARSLMI